MKFLYLTRHIKSSWDIPEIDDLNRTLKVERINDGSLIVNRLKELDYKVPELIIHSHSIRTTQTAQFFRNFWKENIELREAPLLYDASAKEVLQVILSISNEFNVVQLVGHNPGFTEFANIFCKQKISNVSTSGTVVFGFKSFKDFNEIDKVNFLEYLSPKSILS